MTSEVVVGAGGVSVPVWSCHSRSSRSTSTGQCTANYRPLPAPSAHTECLSCAACGVFVCAVRAHALWCAAAHQSERGVPIKPSTFSLEYYVYGWFKFENEPEGVRRLDTQWVPVELLATVEDWADHAIKCEERLEAAREAAAEAYG